MILSNAGDRSELHGRSILTLGDTLLEKGLLYGAHFCYLVGNLEFGTYSNRYNWFKFYFLDKVFKVAFQKVQPSAELIFGLHLLVSKPAHLSACVSQPRLFGHQ